MDGITPLAFQMIELLESLLVESLSFVDVKGSETKECTSTLMNSRNHGAEHRAVVVSSVFWPWVPTGYVVVCMLARHND